MNANKSAVQLVENAISRFIVKIRVRCLEATLQGQNDTLEVVRDPITRMQIILARSVTQRELAKARSEYIALLPVGVRNTFKVA